MAGMRKCPVCESDQLVTHTVDMFWICMDCNWVITALSNDGKLRKCDFKWYDHEITSNTLKEATEPYA